MQALGLQPGDRLRLVFVVPPEIFNKFGEQPILSEAEALAEEKEDLKLGQKLQSVLKSSPPEASKNTASPNSAQKRLSEGTETYEKSKQQKIQKMGQEFHGERDGDQQEASTPSEKKKSGKAKMQIERTQDSPKVVEQTPQIEDNGHR